MIRASILTAALVAGGGAVVAVEPAQAHAPRHWAKRTTVKLSPHQARHYARWKMRRTFGWGRAQHLCLKQLWFRESGWRMHADNPISSAYGIPQAMTSIHFSTAGAARYRSDAKVQVRWGLRYINGRYGAPCRALATSNAKGWY